MNLYTFLDCHFGTDGEEQLKLALKEVKNIDETFGSISETALHVATRRRRLGAIKILLQHGADARQETYLQIISMLIDAGAKLHYPGEAQNNQAYFNRLITDATEEVKKLLLKTKPFGDLGGTT